MSAETAKISMLYACQDVQLPSLPTGNIVLDTAKSDGVGGQVWPAAAALCRWLQTADLQGCSVLELGAGPGLCGLYAAGSGASAVLITDGSEAVVRLIDANILRNKHLLPEGVSVGAETLRWGGVATEQAAGAPYDLVIASDVIYGGGGADAGTAVVLCETLATLLDQKPPPRVVISHQHRGGGVAGRYTLAGRETGNIRLVASSWDSSDTCLARFQSAAVSRGLSVDPLLNEQPLLVRTQPATAIAAEVLHMSVDLTVMEVTRNNG